VINPPPPLRYPAHSQCDVVRVQPMVEYLTGETKSILNRVLSSMCYPAPPFCVSVGSPLAAEEVVALGMRLPSLPPSRLCVSCLGPSAASCWPLCGALCMVVRFCAAPLCGSRRRRLLAAFRASFCLRHLFSACRPPPPLRCSRTWYRPAAGCAPPPHTHTHSSCCFLTFTFVMLFPLQPRRRLRWSFFSPSKRRG